MATIDDALTVIGRIDWEAYDLLFKAMMHRREQLLAAAAHGISVNDTVEVAGKGRGKVRHIDPDWDVHVEIPGKSRKVVVASRYVRKC